MSRLRRVIAPGRSRRKQQVIASPPKILALGFVALILVGTCLLKLPFATKSPISWFEALFAATSAVTVTGLSIFDVAGTLTFWGKLVVIILVQIGGLGFVTFAILAASTLGKRITLGQQALAMEAFNQTNVNELQSTAVSVIKYTLSIQLIAFICLGVWWMILGASAPIAFFRAFFHVSMSFNNAGFMLYAPSDTSIFHRDLITVLITTLSK